MKKKKMNLLEIFNFFFWNILNFNVVMIYINQKLLVLLKHHQNYDKDNIFKIPLKSMINIFFKNQFFS